ncbi:MAG TPA: N-acetylmuramoyl-L-alanine amidase [Saprospiraceae bacterium]|nr:N-acetylmuramoyl-L-alanine amidase [Saprospiraceae bacterium]
MKLATVLKTTLITVLSGVLALLTSSFEPGVCVPLKGHEPVVKTIVIDPGHGGKDPGCSGRHSIEKDVALSIGLKLGELIGKHFPELKVIYTRSTDVFIPLDERAQIANKAEADLFISIHCNYVSRRNQAQGSETYVMGLHRAEDNLDVAKRENASILMEDNYIERYDGYDPNSPEGHIILSMYQNAHLEQSILLADFIEKQFTKGLARKSRGVKQAGFVVLRNTTMPSVLIETGFLSHDIDEAFLGEKSNHGSVAQAIFNAFSEYKAHMDGYIPEEEPVVTAPIVVEPTLNGVSFYVQLAASRTPLSTEIAKWKVSVFVETKQENGYYKYLAGPFTDAGQASALQKELRDGCCKDAFVVAYRDNQRIPLTEAIASSK